MRSMVFCVILMSVWIAIGHASAQSQVVVDATPPPRERLRPPTEGSFGSNNNVLPIKIAVGLSSASADRNGNPILEFTLTNTGKTDISLPLSPNPRDFEPVDPQTSYSVTVLSIYMTSRNNPRRMMPGKVDLYGSPTLSDSMAVLHPGEFLRVRSLGKFATIPEPSQSGEERFVCHVALKNESVSVNNGHTTERTDELGTADSGEITLP